MSNIETFTFLLLSLIINTFYINKEIFHRELINNAFDVSFRASDLFFEYRLLVFVRLFDSWWFSIETNDAGAWSSIPSRCVGFVQDYMIGGQYVSDSTVVAKLSLAFGQRVKIGGDGKDVWVFDVDETLLFNLPYGEARGFGYIYS